MTVILLLIIYDTQRPFGHLGCKELQRCCFVAFVPLFGAGVIEYACRCLDESKSALASMGIEDERIKKENVKINSRSASGA